MEEIKIKKNNKYGKLIIIDEATRWLAFVEFNDGSEESIPFTKQGSYTPELIVEELSLYHNYIFLGKTNENK